MVFIVHTLKSFWAWNERLKQQKVLTLKEAVFFFFYSSSDESPSPITQQQLTTQHVAFLHNTLKLN